MGANLRHKDDTNKAAATVSATAGLLLARLLVSAAKPPTRSVVEKSLRRYFEQRVSPAQWQTQFDDALTELRLRLLIDAKALALTEAGRQAALDFLGVGALPANVKWQTIINKYLLPRAMGVAVDSPKARDKIAASDGLRAAILTKHYDLPTGATPTLGQATDALAWRQLGVSTTKRFDKQAVISLLLSRLLELEQPLEAKKLPERLAAVATGARRSSADELRLAILRGWVDQQPASSTQAVDSDGHSEPGSFRLADFAEAVRRTATGMTNGRFGESNVFIASVWKRFSQEPMGRAMTMEQFKERLVEANRENLLALSRADLAEAMDPAQVAASEIRSLHATFHFIRL